MSTEALTRRGALAGLGALAATGLGGCNTTPTAGVQTQAATGYRISAIEVNTSPLLAQSGNPTASWAQQALPGALAQALASHMAPGDPGGATLNVRIDSIYLGGGGPGDPDIMKGAATLGSVGAMSLRGISTYIPSSVDQALPEQALQGRVQALSQAFAYRLARKMGH